MQKPNHHLFVCSSFRASGEPQGICHKKGAGDYLAYIENELVDRGLDNVQVSATGCLKVCDQGPVLIIYPDNIWYGKVTGEDMIDEILDALEAGEVVTRYQIGEKQE